MNFISTPKYSPYKHDGNRRRPLARRLIGPLLFGIVASFGALFLELLLSLFLGDPDKLDGFFLNTLTPLLIAAVLIEEIFKFIFVYKNFQELKVQLKDYGEKNHLKKELIVNSLLIGLGFSGLELLFIFLNLPAGQSLRHLGLAVPGMVAIHILTAGFIGYFIAATGTVTLAFIAGALLAVFSVHLIYNSLIIYDFRPSVILSYLLALILTLIVITFGTKDRLPSSEA